MYHFNIFKASSAKCLVWRFKGKQTCHFYFVSLLDSVQHLKEIQ